AAPAATSRGPRSAPPASTATTTMISCSAGLIARLGGDHLASLVAAADRADSVRKPRAVALGARVVRHGAELVLRAPPGGPSMRLLLLGDGHRVGRLAGPSLLEPDLGQLGPARVSLAFVRVTRLRVVQIDPAYGTQSCTVGPAHEL